MRSMPTSSIEPLPRVVAIVRNKSTASGTNRFPMVEPGKKPSRGISSIADEGRSTQVKSPSTGCSGMSGNGRDSLAADYQRKSLEMSIGTYAGGSPLTTDRCLCA